MSNNSNNLPVEMDKNKTTIKANEKAEIDDLFVLANNYFEEGDFEKAKLYYEKAIELGANFPEVFGNLASTLLELNEYARAIPLFEKCLDLEPSEKAKYIINYAIALFRNGEKEKAINILQTILGKTKNEHLEALAHYHMGLFILEQNPKKALKHFKTSLKFEALAETYYEASCAFARLSKKGEAAKMLKKAVKLDSSFKQIALNDPDLKEIIAMPSIKQFFKKIPVK